jgi:hypothetical protein
MRERFPEVWYSYTGGAIALRGLGRPGEAAELLSGAAPRFAWEPTFPLELARLAASRVDGPVAEKHWRTVLTFDGRPWWAHGNWPLCSNTKANGTRPIEVDPIRWTGNGVS